MSSETLEIILARFFQAKSNSIRFVWHGGEPMLAGLSFYRKVVQFQKRLASPEHSFRNSIQTNGTLINARWIDFFAGNNFGVGVSLDGPEFIHNYARRTAKGDGSFDTVMQGISKLRQAGITTGVIAVVNNFSVRYPDEMFHFFYSNGLPFSVNDCVIGPTSDSRVGDLAVNPREYAEFLLRVFDLWLATENPTYQIKPLTDFVRAVMGQRPHLCKFTGSCYRYVTVDINGDVYPCHEYPNSDCLLGNLVESSLEDIVSSEVYQEYYSGREQVHLLCTDCKWTQACQGWCMRTWNGRTTLSSLAEHQYCETLRYVFESISLRLSALGYAPIHQA